MCEFAHVYVPLHTPKVDLGLFLSLLLLVKLIFEIIPLIEHSITRCRDCFVKDPLSLPPSAGIIILSTTSSFYMGSRDVNM